MLAAALGRGTASSLLFHSGTTFIRIMIIGATVVFLSALASFEPVSTIRFVFLLVLCCQGCQSGFIHREAFQVTLVLNIC